MSNKLKDDNLVDPIKLNEVFFVALLLTVILFLFFGQSLFPNRVLSAAEGVFSTPFFEEVKDPDYTYPPNPILFDQVYQFTPWRHFAWETLNRGGLPLWNPYSYTGTPFVATMQSAVFYPINLLLTFVPFEYTLLWSALLRLLIAGISTYLLVRYYGLGSIASLISAVSFMLSGFLIVWLGHPHTNVAIWLPSLILLAEILLHATHKGKILSIMAILALVIGIQITGGHIETSVDILFAFGIYYLVRWAMIILQQKHSIVFKTRYLVFLPGISVLLGLAIAGIQLVPFIEWLPLSAEYHARGGLISGFQFVRTGFWKELFELPLIVYPNLYNNPTWNDYPYWSFLPFGGSYTDHILYVGTITLLLSLVGILTRWKGEPLVRVWVIIGLIGFGRAFYLPVFDWINQLPILSLGAPDRLRLIFSFALCILAGFGVEALWNGHKNELAEKIWIRGSFIIIGIGLLVVIAGNTVLPAIKGKVTTYGRERVDIELANRAAPPQHDLEYYYAQVDEMVNGLLAAYRINNLAMYMPVFWTLIGLVLILWYRRNRSQKAGNMERVLLVLVVIDLIDFGHNYNPSISVDQFYPTTSVVQQIDNDNTLFRFTVLRQDLIPDAQIMFHFQDIRGLDFPTYWYNEYMNLVSDRIPWLNYGMIFDSIDSPLLSVLNIKYVAASQPDMLDANPNIRVSAKIGDIYLGEMINVSPRAFMVYDAVIANSDEEAADILRNEPESVFHRVVLSDVKGNPSHVNNQFGGNYIASNVNLLEYEAGYSIWHVSSDENGYLFLGDAYYPGWKAYLDNQPTELYRANIAFRAVYIPKGDHTISFRYEPTSILNGTLFTAISMVVVLILLGLAYGYTVKSKNNGKSNFAESKKVVRNSLVMHDGFWYLNTLHGAQVMVPKSKRV